MNRWVPLLIVISWLPWAGADAADLVPVTANMPPPDTTPPLSPVVVKPIVVSQPSAREFQQGYPVKGWNDHVAGRAHVKCDLLKSGILTGCAISEETPAGEGFGEAALKLMSLYRLTPFTVDGVASDHQLIMDIEFPAARPPGEPIANEIVVSHPWWTCPDSNTLPNRYYLDQARNRQLAGLVDIECRALTTGKTLACTWIKEDPPGHGFGEKAAMLGCQIKMHVFAPDGISPEVRIIRTPMRFKIGS